MAAPRQPPFVLCYLCGRKYGTKSIAIHEPNCIKKWHEDNRKLPKHLRRKRPPPRPDYSQLSGTSFNEDVLIRMNEESYEASKAQLIPCEFCGRTFLPERLAIHQKSCRAEKPAASPRLGAKINGVRISKNAGTANIIKSADNNEDTEEKYSFINQTTKRPVTSHGSEGKRKSSEQKVTREKTVVQKTNNKRRDKIEANDDDNDDLGTIKCSFCELTIPLSKIQKHLVKCNQEEKIPCGLCHNKIPASQIQKHLVKCNEEKLKEIQLTSSSETRDRSNEKMDEEASETSSRGSSRRKKKNRPGTRTLHRAADTSSSSRETRFNEKEVKQVQTNYPTYDKDEQEDKPVECVHCKTKVADLWSHKCAKSRKKKSPNESKVQEKPDLTYEKENQSENEDEEMPDLAECNICGRRFASDRLSKHISICKKTLTKQRKVFNSSKQRAQGTDAVAIKSTSQQATPAKQSNWRQTHDDFINSIRAAKKVKAHLAQGGKASDLPPPPPSLNPDYVHCKHCDRKFNPTVAERHIPKCATTLNRPKPPKQRALDMVKPRNQTYNSPSNTFSPRASKNSPKQQQAAKSSPRYGDFNRPKTSEFRTHQNNDPYKPKVFNGIGNVKGAKASGGYSYNAMNRTNTLNLFK